MGRLLDLYCGVLKVAIALCLLAMVVLVFSNVVLRYVFNSGIATSEELSRWLLVWLTFLGAIVALRQHAHLGVDTLIRALPPKGKFVCFVASYLLMLYADWLLTLAAGSRQFSLSTTPHRPRAFPLACFSIRRGSSSESLRRSSWSMTSSASSAVPQPKKSSSQ